MSRIDELKKQNPFLTIDGINIINDLVGKSKYTEMLVNLIKNDRLNQHDNRRAELEEFQLWCRLQHKALVRNRL